MKAIKTHPTLYWGLGVTLLFLLLGFVHLDFIDALELKFYDLRLNLMTSPDKAEDIVIVDIDDDSIEKLGRWPWPRSIVADGIRKISAGHPRVIGLNIIFSEPDNNAGLQAIGQVQTIFTRDLAAVTGEKGVTFLETLNDIRTEFDHDADLADAIRTSANVVLPVFFKGFIGETGDTDATPPALNDQAIQTVSRAEGIECPSAGGIILPIKAFLTSAAGLGHINFSCDMDGVTRREQLIYEYKGLYIPSYTLTLTRRFIRAAPEKIRADIGSDIRIAALDIPTTLNTELLVSFKGPAGSFKRYAFYDVINDKISLNVFKDKLVLVSTSAAGIMNPLSAPTDPGMAVGEFTANAVWTMLNRKFIQSPAWSQPLEWLLILIVGLLLIFVFPKLKAKIAGISFVLLTGVFIGGALYAFVAGGLWLQVSYPVLELIIGYIGVVSIRYFITETRKEKVEGESAETNRMLGLSFQSQGMLDMAFDKFRRVPVDDETKDLLYNLALDYERKRQFNKAVSVYEYIEQHDNAFKDVPQKKKRLMQASETMVFGEGFPGSTPSDGLLSTGTDTRPTMGRYEIMKQLGKGAMGIVYLGQDPRINRTTAIKTFRFTDDFDPEEIDEMKKKFFREAESAGTLSHPNIVTIYDAGEEQDLAFIAMEYLEGEDLQKYTKKGKLLPLREVVTIGASVAEGLAYAHDKGIVHRDIKPANVMRLKSGMIKITDFGIARITASSQTRTGVVKGTPYYMSPEQISGQKVDGRSDIFSLGVMMYQMLTGRVPFSGDSPAALMHQILNVQHPDPRKFNPKIVRPLVSILDKALAKDPDKRYARASEMAAHLKILGQKIDEAMAQRKASQSN